MSRRSEFYKGRRKKRNYAIIPGVILLLVFSVGIVLFYSTQKYAVISDDGVTVELPLLSIKTVSRQKQLQKAMMNPGRRCGNLSG